MHLGVCGSLGWACTANRGTEKVQFTKVLRRPLKTNASLSVPYDLVFMYKPPFDNFHFLKLNGMSSSFVIFFY